MPPPALQVCAPIDFFFFQLRRISERIVPSLAEINFPPGKLERAATRVTCHGNQDSTLT